MNRRLDDTDPNETTPIETTDPAPPPDVRTDPVARVLSGLGGATPWAPAPKQGASSDGEAFAAHASAPHAVPAAHRDETVMDPVLVDITSPDGVPTLTDEDHDETPAAVAQRPELGVGSSGNQRNSTTAPVPRERRLTPLFWAAVGAALGVALLGVAFVVRPVPATVTTRATVASAVAGLASAPAPASLPPAMAAQPSVVAAPAAALSILADAAPPVAMPGKPRGTATVNPGASRPTSGRAHPTSNERDIDHEL